MNNQIPFLILKTVLSGALIVTVSEVAKQNNLVAAIIYALPLVPLMAFAWVFLETKDSPLLARRSFGTFWSVLPTLPLFLALSWLLFSLTSVYGAAPEPENLKAAKLANTVLLDEVGVRNLRLKTVEAEEQTFEETIFALGRIEVRPGFSAVLSSRVSGRALTVSARPDHEVKEGEALVIVEGRQAGNPPPQITLTAPMAGIVSEISVVPGEPVTPDASLLRIIDLKSVYGLAAVPEHLAGRIREGLTTRIRLPGWPDQEWVTKIEHVGATADRKSGTLEVALHIENADLKLRPGMRAEFSIVTGLREGVMSVPKQAVQGEPSHRFLYVADDSLPNAFVKVPVEIGASNDRFVEINRGLFPGDKVVTEGAYSLAFAGKGSISLKEALDAAHGHEHNADGSEMGQGNSAAILAQETQKNAKFSLITVFSLAVNAVLLAFLTVVTLRRRSTDSPNTPPETN